MPTTSNVLENAGVAVDGRGPLADAFERAVLDESVITALRQLASAAAHPGEDLLGELIGLFARDAVARVAAIEVAWRARQPREAARAAHTLKGAAGQVGALRVVAAAQAVERLTEAAFDADVVAGLRGAVDEAVGALRARLVDELTR